MQVRAVRDIGAVLRRVPGDALLAAGLLVAVQLELAVTGPVPQHLVASIGAFGLAVPFAWRR